MDRFLEHVSAIPPTNAVIFWTTLFATIVMLWAAIGATAVALRHYRPRWRRYRGDALLKGRRAWAWAFGLWWLVGFGQYRIRWVWDNPSITLPIEGAVWDVIRVGVCLFLLVAFWPRHTDA